MIPPVRKFALTAHVTASVGWLGSVAAFLVLAIAGLRSSDAETVRASYLAMNLLGWYIIVPLCLASLATGLVQALGTPWGLLRHYWVIIKLLITVLSTVILMVHMRPITQACLGTLGYDCGNLERDNKLLTLPGHEDADQMLGHIGDSFAKAIDSGTTLIRLLGNIGWGRDTWPSERDISSSRQKSRWLPSSFPVSSFACTTCGRSPVV